MTSTQPTTTALRDIVWGNVYGADLTETAADDVVTAAREDRLGDVATLILPDWGIRTPADRDDARGRARRIIDAVHAADAATTQPTAADVKRAAAIGHLESALSELRKATTDLAAVGNHSIAHNMAADAIRQADNALRALQAFRPAR